MPPSASIFDELSSLEPFANPQGQSSQREGDLAKFSTLFSPSTPRASPTLVNATLPNADPVVFDSNAHLESHKTRPSRSGSISSQQSDFGAFVSVSASDDPLSGDFTFFEEEGGLPTPVMVPTPTTAAPNRSEDTKKIGVPRPSSDSSSNPSLSFFDQFAQGARERSATRSAVLDELLLHQDDPLYFLKEQDDGKATATTESKSSPEEPEPDTSITPSTSEIPDRPAASVLDLDVNHDLDHDYFRISPSSSTNTSIRHRRLRAPTRSSSIPMPVPTLAPPIESSQGATRATPPIRSPPTSPILSSQLAHSPSPDDGLDTHDGEADDDSLGPGHLARAASFQSLSGSSPVRWMSTLLRGPPQNPGRHIDSVFESIDKDDTAARPVQHRPTHHQPSPEPTFTHSSAFAPPPPPTPGSVSHIASPFSPQVYIPPTGAPGYTGESHAWDKGFSDELEAERDRECGRHQRSKTMPVGISKEPPANVKPAGGGGWGSGFGFSFGSVRGAKGSTNSPSYKEGLPSSLSQPAGSGSEAFWNGAERGRGLGSGSRNGSEGSDLGSGRGRRPGDSNGAGGRGGNDNSGDKDVDDGIGAFIERKSGNIELVGRKATTTPILTSELASMLRPSLPALSRLPRSWSLLYSLDQDGISLNTLYSKCEAHLSRRPQPGEINNSGMLLVVRDADGGIFGAWLAEGIRLNKSGKGYFGGGESFLWKYTEPNPPKVFKCTGKNNYIALCEPEYISFGGGDGHYGLYLDDTLLDGSSAPCPTFDNEPLCSPGPRKGLTVTFECVGLEVWGMGS